MRKKNTNSIAYLFREMDPTEEVEFERSLTENENLLIEVESLRKVQERLNSLPSFTPPAHVVDSIKETAAKQAFKKQRFRFGSVHYAAAAVLLAGFFAGAILLETNSSNDSSDSASLGAPAFQFSNNAPSSASSESRIERRKITPWVDNNEVIRFTDRGTHTEGSSVDSLFKNSYQRLTPVTDPLQSAGYQRGLHLTGSRP
jgi:hypothetical protein